jgi:hypothetical protein
MALQAGVKLQLPLGGPVVWSERFPPTPPSNVSPSPIIQGLETRLGYRFHRPELLKEALVHPSFLAIAPQGELAYDRLEFLGDAVIDIFVLSILYGRDPDLVPGQLTAIKSALVSNGSLGYLAMAKLQLHKYLLYDSAALDSHIKQAVVELANFKEDQFWTSVYLWYVGAQSLSKETELCAGNLPSPSQIAWKPLLERFLSIAISTSRSSMAFSPRSLARSFTMFHSTACRIPSLSYINTKTRSSVASSRSYQMVLWHLQKSQKAKRASSSRRTATHSCGMGRKSCGGRLLPKRLQDS